MHGGRHRCDCEPGQARSVARVALLSLLVSLILSRVFDHLVVAGPDLSALVDEAADRLDVAATTGGRHDGGTHNALFRCDGHSYVELVAPDPLAPATSTLARACAALTAPTLLAWAVASTGDVNATTAAFSDSGYRLAQPEAWSRHDGRRLLRWLAATPDIAVMPAVPFVIWWGSPDDRPPANLEPSGVESSNWTVATTDPAALRSLLTRLRPPTFTDSLITIPTPSIIEGNPPWISIDLVNGARSWHIASADAP